MTDESREIVAIDFGTSERGSGFVFISTTATNRDPAGQHNTRVITCGMRGNQHILSNLKLFTEGGECSYELALEMIQSYGNNQGKTLHHTALWIGRATQVYHDIFCKLPKLVLRSTSRSWIAGAKANDSRVMGAIIERFGSDRKDAVGKKTSPGPLYGFKADVWQAMAVAIAFAEGCKTEPYLG